MIRLALTLFVSGVALVAQPFVPLDGVVNNANFLPACATNGGVAQGSLFAVFGREIGPAALVTAASFPLQTTLGDVSVRVAMRGSTYDAWPLYATATQLGAILPSAVPPGNGTLTVTYRGRAAEPVPIRVRRNVPGIFTTNQRGTGQAIVENVSASGATTLNGSTRALRPGQLATIWATGLGPVSGNEAAGPLLGDQTGIETRVWVGDRLARVVYRGRSGCCAGIDQIVFETPSGIEGCQVPINFEAGGMSSNFGSIAIASSGICAATNRPAPIDSSSAGFRLGLIMFLDGFGSVLLPSALEDHVRLGFFQQGRAEGNVESPLYAFEPNAEMPAGACAVRYGTAFPAQPASPRQLPLDAGPELRITGPGGSFRLLQSAINSGNYEDSLRVTLSPGLYRIDNGAGGRDVGAFALETDAITVKLLTPTGNIPRHENLTVTWDYQGPPEHLLTIFGSSNSCGRELISFSCVARAADRRFVVPTRILSLLPASTSFFGVSNGALNISTTSPGGLRRFAASGLDLGLFLQLSISAIRPTYE